jgi:hypothetical protein
MVRMKRSDRASFAGAYIIAPDRIDIAQSVNGMTLVQGERHREFKHDADEPVSVTDRYGTRLVRAGWHGKEFVVLSNDSSRLSIEEHFQRGPTPDTLSVRVVFKQSGMKSVDAHSLYRRVSAEAPHPELEGPPAPGSR